jgi:hypothetical protein
MQVPGWALALFRIAFGLLYLVKRVVLPNFTFFGYMTFVVKMARGLPH